MLTLHILKIAEHGKVLDEFFLSTAGNVIDQPYRP